MQFKKQEKALIKSSLFRKRFYSLKCTQSSRAATLPRTPGETRRTGTAQTPGQGGGGERGEGDEESSEEIGKIRKKRRERRYQGQQC